MRLFLVLTSCLGAFASSGSIVATVGSTVSVSVQTIVSYTSFNISPYNTTTYASFVSSDATATTFAFQRECYTGIAAFPTFPICYGFTTSPKTLILGSTSVAFLSTVPLSNNQGMSESSSTWLFSEGCSANGGTEMICTVEQTGPSYLMSNPWPTGLERSALTYTGTSTEFPAPTTTPGVTRRPTGSGITGQTSTFTVPGNDMRKQFIVVTAGLEKDTSTTSGAGVCAYLALSGAWPVTIYLVLMSLSSPLLFG
ncbi:hypothetical protein EV356DRAFT_35345 [Viridothelium virens]|uniref:Uncharacterized protein n=1 Tax=Viridothelium virens TaxID=1048519 RepID=A0A6A6GSY7_VIRVR|nr:hypothetical protein EV356DRAFT_35345 [Viridothelium virens]